MEVRVVNLKRYFARTKAVDDISFSFASGQVYGFVGPNGAGKTTTMRILATLDEPTEGDAFVDGVSVVEYPEKARRMIGFMPDSLPSHSDITVHEYVDFFARAHGLRGRRRRRMVKGIEQFCGLTAIQEKFVRALSKGMKQRVSLARAMVHDPPVLVLDEPAAGLDPRARVELRELMRALAAHGKAILISSHILTELSEICDGTVIIEKGKILRAGRIRDLVAQDSPHSIVAIRAAEGPERLHKELIQMPNVLSAKVMDSEVHVQFSGGEETSAELLAGLMQRGLRIWEFRHCRRDLEDVFMSVTTGEVQ